MFKILQHTDHKYSFELHIRLYRGFMSPVCALLTVLALNRSLRWQISIEHIVLRKLMQHELIKVDGTRCDLMFFALIFIVYELPLSSQTSLGLHVAFFGFSSPSTSIMASFSFSFFRCANITFDAFLLPLTFSVSHNCATVRMNCL